MEIEKLISNKSQLFGRWWFGSDRRSQYKGKLTFGDKIYLEITGKTNIDLTKIRYDELRGITLEGNEFILIDNFVSKTGSNNVGGKSGWTILLEPSDVILFSHTSNSKPRNTKLTNLSLSIPYFDYWLGAKLFEHKIMDNTITYKDSDKISFCVNGIEITFGTQLHGLLSWSYNTKNAINMKQIAYVNMHYSNDIDYKEAIEVYRKLEGFFRLAYANQFFIKLFTGSSVYGAQSDKPSKRPNVESKEIYQSRIANKVINIPSFIDNLFLFKLDALEDPQEIIRRWFEIEPSLAPVYQLLFSSLEEDIYIEERFLNLVNAIEIFHRRFRKITRMSADKWEPHKLAILSNWQGEYRATVKRWLAHANDISLENRLKSILKSVSNTGFRGLMPDTIKDIADTRNAFIHEDFGATTNNLNLVEVNEALTEILLISIMQELGFKNHQIQPLTKNVYIFKYSNYY